jgi:predicted  nucleic acid-binding Zn-ribbon protein
MNADLEKLKELQGLDSEITSLKTEIAAQPKLVQQIDAKLNQARKRVDDAKAAIQANELGRRKFEQEIQSWNDKIVKFREQSSSVKTNEQYKALLSEISQAEKHIRDIEDKILEGMEAVESQHSELKAAEAALKADSVVIEKEKGELAERIKVTEQQMAEKSALRKQCRASVAENVLSHYDRVVKHRGTGLAAAKNGRCTSCHTMLRPQVYQDVRNETELIFCESCSRILYFGGDDMVDSQIDPAIASGIVEREWAFLPGIGPNGAFVVFVNAKGQALLKAYDARTGELLDRRVAKGASYRHAFATELHEARSVFVDEPAVEEKYKDKLPEEILLDLQHQVPGLPEQR